MIRLYELAGEDAEKRFSPYCWRIVMALAQKGLAFETVPWRFTEKAAIAFSGQGTVPVLVDGDVIVSDSWRIALYLEEHYPDRPALFGSAAATGAAMLIKQWTEKVLQAQILKIVALDIANLLGPADRAYFLASREQRLGMPLAQFTADRESSLQTFGKSLAPLQATLETQAFIAGAAPAFVDHIVFGAFQWARVVSSATLLEDGAPITLWRERMLNLYGGLARQTPAAC